MSSPGANAELGARSSLGRFAIVRLLGVGGMGAVYEARDAELGRSVALKVLHAARAEHGLRLLREAQALAQLAHPNIVGVHEVGVEGEEPFIAMEYVEGVTLDEHLGRSRRPWREILGLFVQAGRALAAAHARGIVHRDFKPSNVLVDREGRVRVGDFGLARMDGTLEAPGPGHEAAPVAHTEAETLDDAGTSTLSPAELSPSRRGLLAVRLTAAGALVGTPRYMAPEQRARLAATARSDQYSFCVAFWEALAGDLPPAAPRGAPRWLRRALVRGLATAPSERFPSMAALLEVLERTPARRRRLALMASVPIVAAAIGAAALLAPGSSPAKRCDQGAARIAAVWDEASRGRARAAFLRTGQPHAAEVFARVERALAARVDAWATAHQDVCEDTHVRGEQSEALLDRRMACLERARRQIAALSTLWQEGQVDLDAAVEAATGAGQLEACADASPAELPPPRDRARHASLTAEIDQLVAATIAGRLPGTFARSRELVTEARALGHLPTLAEVLHHAGDLECDAGSSPAGVALLEEAVRTAGEARDDARLAGGLLSLMRCLAFKESKVAEASALFAAADAAVARLGGRDDLIAALGYARGCVRDLVGQHAAAEVDLTRALETRERLFGQRHHLIARTLRALADVKAALGDPDAALGLYRRALDLFEELEGPDSLNVAKHLNNMSGAHVMKGEYDAAAAMAERSLAIRERILPPGHHLIGMGLNALGVMREYQGRRVEARALYERAAALYEKIRPDHPNLAMALGNIANHLEPAEAIPIHERILAIKISAYGPNSPQAAHTLNALGETRADTGDRSGAREALTRALTIRRQIAPQSDEVIKVLLSLALLESADGRGAEALQMAEEALRSAEKAHEAGHPVVIGALLTVAEVQLDVGRVREARERLEQLVSAIDAKKLPNNMVSARFLLGRAFWATGERRRGRALVVELAHTEVPRQRAFFEKWLREHPSR